MPAPVPHACGETVTVSVCTLHQLAVIAAAGLEAMPPLNAITLIGAVGEDVWRLIENARKQREQAAGS